MHRAFLFILLLSFLLSGCLPAVRTPPRPQSSSATSPLPMDANTAIAPYKSTFLETTEIIADTYGFSNENGFLRSERLSNQRWLASNTPSEHSYTLKLDDLRVVGTQVFVRQTDSSGYVSQVEQSRFTTLFVSGVVLSKRTGTGKTARFEHRLRVVLEVQPPRNLPLELASIKVSLYSPYGKGNMEIEREISLDDGKLRF